jgi:hypothetical protein
LRELTSCLSPQKFTYKDQPIHAKLPHEPLRPFHQVRVVQVKNDPPAGAMNKRGDRDGKFRAIVNPHDIAGPDTFDQAAEDSTYHPAMKEPG